jgi:flavin-dependent dehydrogenase
MVDALVIGARCAGASTALLLARRGRDVLLVDRARFPSEIPHGHFIHRHGPARLRDWGLLDRVLATGCPPITSITTDFGDFPLVGRPGRRRVPVGPGRDGRARCGACRGGGRSGAELREGFPVHELVYDEGRVVRFGVELDRAGTARDRCRRKASNVARWVEAPAYEDVPTLTCWYFSYWSGVPSEGSSSTSTTAA